MKNGHGRWSCRTCQLQRGKNPFLSGRHNPTSFTWPQLLKLGVHGKPPLQLVVPVICQPPIKQVLQRVRSFRRTPSLCRMAVRTRPRVTHTCVADLIVRTIRDTDGCPRSSCCRTCSRARTCSATTTADRGKTAYPLSPAKRCRCCWRCFQDSSLGLSSSTADADGALSDPGYPVGKFVVVRTPLYLRTPRREAGRRTDEP